MIRTLVDFWVNPKFRNYDVTNIVFYCVNLCMGALIGSLVSIAVICTAVYSTLQLLTGRLRWALPNPVKAVFLAFCGFFLAEAIAAAFNPSMLSLNEVAENLPFLGLAGIYSITFVDRAKLLRAVETCAAAAALGAALLLIVWFGEQSRSELAAGNPSVLALLGGVLYVLTVGGAFRRKSLVSLGFLIAAAGAAYIVVLSGTRAIWPVLLIVPFLSLLSFGSRRVILWGVPAVLLTVNCMVMLGVSASHTVNNRIEALKTDLQLAFDGDLSGSLGQRVQIYRAGYALFQEKPVFGYGPGNEREEIAAKTAEIGGERLAYSHAHNAVLNVALRSGLIGVAAFLAVLLVPFVVALRARKDAVGWAGFYAALGILLVYICSGVTGLTLGHDIHDTVFIAGMCYALYLIFGRLPAADNDQRR